MAQQGYWVLCEDIKANPEKDKEPSLCMARVEGFHYADVMGSSRTEVLNKIKKALRSNIQFLIDCYNDVPPPAYSDQPPPKKTIKGGAYLFIALAEIGLVAEMITPLLT
ncbi:MAG: hypothetical protein GW903_09680 [Alphaproteobacteria bacterium]|nr:hypothetical protein [Alphaproteobacteria bacterium]NCQ89276.1 hypothetical protein [Alphaproteobacteria bacterium]NCT08139.1 hypothetical protein [Alphaproteobacteria bacterium]